MKKILILDCRAASAPLSYPKLFDSVISDIFSLDQSQAKSQHFLSDFSYRLNLCLEFVKIGSYESLIKTLNLLIANSTNLKDEVKNQQKVVKTSKMTPF